MSADSENSQSTSDLLAEIESLKKQVAELTDNKFDSTFKSTYKEFFDNAPLPYQSLDENSNIIAINEPWLNFFGYSYDEVIGKNFSSFLSPVSRSLYLQRFLKFKKNGLIHNEEFELVKKSGKFVTMSLNGIIQNSELGYFRATHCILSDISWHKKIEEEIGIFMESVENSTDAIGMSTPEGKHFYQNKAFDQLFGNVGENPPETLYVNQKIGEKVFKSIMAGNKWSGEVEMYAHDGSILNILLRAYASKDANGEIRVLVGVHTDISKQKKAERDLKKSKEKYKEASVFLETLFNVIPDIIGVQDRHHNIIRYNEAGYDFLDKDCEEVKGKKCYELIGKNAPCKPCATSITYKTKKPAQIEKHFPEIDTYLDVYAYPILDEKGEVKLVIEHLRDNTARKKAEEELILAKEHAEESDKLKSVFLANLSHEIRTPMNGILGFTELLENTEISSQKKNTYIEIIKNSGKHLLSIINDIIEISRIETGLIKPHLTNVEINSLIYSLHEVIKMNIPQEKKIKLEIIKSKPDRKVVVVTDEVKLRQILSNLLTNAIKYTDKGHVGYGYEVNSELTFFVKDTGIGIDKKDQEIIFERFRRVDEEITSRKRGSGLGLAISKAYVEMLNGSIQVESEKGKGSVFSFSIPFQQPAEGKNKSISSKKAEASKSKKNKITILVAEDDEFNYMYFAEVLQSAKYKLIRANNGQEAVDICKSNPNIQIVLMDIKMPVMDGFEAYRKIKEFNPNLPVIAQTAYALSDDEKNIQKAGFTGYITKPISVDELLQSITKALRSTS